MAVSFDLFGTLVAVDRPADPARTAARELSARDVPVPTDWASAFRESYRSVPAGRERSLDAHVRDALASRGVEVSAEVVSDAVLAAFADERAVRTRDGAREAVAAAADRGPVAVCSNCSVPGLVSWALEASALDPDRFDAVVTSVDCGWRKPDPRAFEAVADRGITDLGGEFVHVDATPLAALPAELEGRAWD